MRLSPYLYLIRLMSHVVSQGLCFGVCTCLLTTSVASFYFSYLAHLNHAPYAEDTQDYLVHQIRNTNDIDGGAYGDIFLLGLDRQTLHHLFPTIDHSQLYRLRDKMKICYKKEPFEKKSISSLNRVLLCRLFSRSVVVWPSDWYLLKSVHVANAYQRMYRVVCRQYLCRNFQFPHIYWRAFLKSLQ